MHFGGGVRREKRPKGQRKCHEKFVFSCAFHCVLSVLFLCSGVCSERDQLRRSDIQLGSCSPDFQNIDSQISVPTRFVEKKQPKSRVRTSVNCDCVWGCVAELVFGDPAGVERGARVRRYLQHFR